jgi:glycosyltransferase involved in cell wall biosynthesis
MMPQVSVIVPNYNHKAYLPKRLKSIAAQSFSNIEIILLDDASTDGSQQLLAEFAENEPRAAFYPNKRNTGSPFAQWNRGVELARADIIWIAESDDYCEADFLDKLLPLMQSDPDIGIAYGQSWLVDEQNNKLNSYQENLSFIYKSDAWQQDFVVDGKQACRNWLLFHNPIPNASGILMRKQAYQKAGRADTSMRLNGDWHLYAKILLHHKLAFKAEHLNYFRVHTQTQRHKSRKNASVYRELVAINSLIRTKVPKSRATADKALAEIGDWWIGNLPYHSYTRENRRLNKNLYALFKKHKNNLPWRIFLTYVISYTRDALTFLHLLKPLKKARSKMFPGKYWDK